MADEGHAAITQGKHGRMGSEQEGSTPRAAHCVLAHEDENVAEAMDAAFCREGFEFEVVHSGNELVSRTRTSDPDVVFIDVSLPDMTGQRASRLVRELSDAYIVLMTDEEDEVDRVVALSTTVDDCVTRSTSTAEVVARARAMLRRPRELEKIADVVPPSSYGPICVDYHHRSATVADKLLVLTPLEFELLAPLVRAAGAPVGRRELTHSAWGHSAGVSSHSVDSHMHNLRRKLAAVDGKCQIVTVRGVGFRLKVTE